MRRRARPLLWAIWGLVVWLAFLAFPARSLLQVRIVEPGDVTTPTPTSVAPLHVLLPTPTPTPVRGKGATSAVGDEPEFYTVQPGDTLWRVALEIGVDLDEMPCLVGPHFRPEQPLVVGERLAFMPMGWRCHTVADGETLTGIAAQYGVTAEEIRAITWNQPVLTAGTLVAGTHLRIPRNQSGGAGLGEWPVLAGPGATGNGFLTFMLEQPLSVAPVTAYAVGGPRVQQAVGPVPKDWPYGSGNFTWPVYGWLSQNYREDHRAIDIAAPVGAFVTAADRGVVIRAGWNEQGYGQFVVIDHNIDYVTLYAHLQDVLVREGEVVGQGQVIGTVGSTGNSTGPHLHFEIRDFGRRTNPLGLLVR